MLILVRERVSMCMSISTQGPEFFHVYPRVVCSNRDAIRLGSATFPIDRRGDGELRCGIVLAAAETPAGDAGGRGDGPPLIRRLLRHRTPRPAGTPWLQGNFLRLTASPGDRLAREPVR